MAILDLLELGNLLTSWRLCIGVGVTALVVIGIDRIIPSETASWAVCIPVAIIGLALSMRWDFRGR